MVFTNSFFFQKKLFVLKQLFATPFKKFNSTKKRISLCIKVHSLKLTDSVEHEFYSIAI